MSQRRRRKLGRKCGTSCNTGGAPLLIIIKLAGNSKIDLQSTTSFSRMCQQFCSSTKWTYSKTRLCAKKWTFPNTLKRSLVTLIKYVNTFKNSMVIRSICKMSKTSFSTSLWPNRNLFIHRGPFTTILPLLSTPKISNMSLPLSKKRF